MAADTVICLVKDKRTGTVLDEDGYGYGNVEAVAGPDGELNTADDGQKVLLSASDMYGLVKFHAETYEGGGARLAMAARTFGEPPRKDHDLDAARKAMTEQTTSFDMIAVYDPLQTGDASRVYDNKQGVYWGQTANKYPGERLLTVEIAEEQQKIVAETLGIIVEAAGVSCPVAMPELASDKL